jgi:hypothetical protein
MMVNVDRNDKTWQIHLNGLLAMLHQSYEPTEGNKAPPLLKACQIIDSPNIGEAVSALQVCDAEKVGILLDIAKLRLRSLNAEFVKLFASTSPPRKLDVQKLRPSIKELHDNLLLIPSMLPEQQSTLIYAGPVGTITSDQDVDTLSRLAIPSFASCPVRSHQDRKAFPSKLIQIPHLLQLSFDSYEME